MDDKIIMDKIKKLDKSRIKYKIDKFLSYLVSEGIIGLS